MQGYVTWWKIKTEANFGNTRKKTKDSLIGLEDEFLMLKIKNIS
jgi:hypothetical protein